MSSEAQLRLRRSKESERKLGRWLMEHDGEDPKWKPGGGLSSSTGRVGHITELQLDVISRTYGAENKQMVVPGALWTFWKKVFLRAREQGKQPLLRWEPTNEDRYVGGQQVPVLHVITEARHAELLWYEREFPCHADQVIADLSDGRKVASQSYSKDQQLRRKPRSK